MTLYIILIFCYIAGILCYISDRLETIKVTYPDFAIRREVREMTTKDAWLGSIWPILLIWLVTKCLIIIINEIVYFLCILVGYRYKDTKIYNRINKWWI